MPCPLSSTSRPDHHVVTVDLGDDAVAGNGPEPRRPRPSPSSRPGGPGRRRPGPGRRGARSRTRPPRPAGAARRRRCRGTATTSVSAIRPVVRVPVLSNTTVSTARDRSSTSPPLISTPRLAPRPVPTMIAIGVARPRAHGQATMSTATAASTPSPGRWATPAQPSKVIPARANTVGTKTPAMRSASRCTGALEPWAASTRRTMPASAVSAPTAVARTVRTPLRLRVAPVTAVAGALVDRHRLAGEHGFVDGRAAGDDDAVDGDLLAWPDPDGVTDPDGGDGNHPLGAAGEAISPLDSALDTRLDQPGLLRAQLQQGPQRTRRPALGPGLQPPPQQEEGDDQRGHVEVQVAAEVARGPGRVGHVLVGVDARAEQQLERREDERRQRAQGDQRVHVGGQ